MQYKYDHSSSIIEDAQSLTQEEFLEKQQEREQIIRSFLEKSFELLTLEEINKGIILCIENIESIVKDSQLLYENRRYPRAFALSISALEEIGKVTILHEMCEIPETKQKLWREYWKDFRSHFIKSSLGDSNTWNDRLLEQMGARIMAGKLEDKLTERLRQSGIYVDYSKEDSRWISPSEITKEMAECNLRRAERALQRVCDYKDRGLYDIELLKLRRDFCKDIFLSISTRPKSGLELVQFVCLLFEKRNLFFDELIQRGILERMAS